MNSEEQPDAASDSSAEGPPKSDHTLLRRFQSGESDAATAIYLRYAKRLERLAEKHTGEALAARFDPEDIVQSVFRTFFRRVSLGHYQIPDGEELWKLLLVIALNKVRSRGEFHRAAKRDASQTVVLLPDAGGSKMSQADYQAYHVLQLTVQDLVADLADWQQQIILMRIDGHDVNSISASCGKSRRTVERTLQQFRRRLRATLDDQGDDE